MSQRTFTLVLTKGTHLVGEAAASDILAAVAAREPLVEIELDLFGSAASGRRATLAIAHVVALTANPTIDAAPRPIVGSTVMPFPGNRR